LQFGFTPKLLELYIEVATDNYNSQKELRQTGGEGAATKRSRVEKNMLQFFCHRFTAGQPVDTLGDAV
jgi:hypothetical protein